MVKKNTEYKGIQKKLVAAIAMVLVASIMVVTSSYAWFTLSTAPEVTGINTSVGSNGNLEIALRTGNTADITNSTGGLTFPAANNYWGNLVDLSNEMYHLDDITLMPAALTATQASAEQYTYGTNADGEYLDDKGNILKLADGTTVKAALAGTDEAKKSAAQTLLSEEGVVSSYTAAVYNFAKSQNSWIKVPTYGADGRISDWNTMSYMNPYQNGGFPASETAAWGVRAIGTASGLSPAELALLNARKAVSGAKGTALNGATSSLNSDAIKVANIAVKNELGQGIDGTDKTNVANTLKNLQTIVDSLDEAVRASVVALGVSQGKTVDPATVFNGAGKIEVADIVWSQTEDQGEAFDYTAYKTMLEEAYAAIKSMKTKLNTATEKLATAEVSYAGLVGVLAEIINPDEILVGGKTVTQHDVGSLVAVFTSGTTPVVTITKGLYADIAKFVGNYSTPASLYVSGTFGGVPLNQNFTVQVQTQVDAPAQGWYLDSAYAWLSGLKAQESQNGETQATMMSDLYAYAIDLAFRTNASNSNLLLQTEAKNRVEGSDATQGAGSYMEFTSGNASFTIKQMANLMSNIRVLFIDGDDTNGTILAVAGLDVGYTEVPVMSTEATPAQMYWHVTVTKGADGAKDTVTVDKSQYMTATKFAEAFTTAGATAPDDATEYLAWEQAKDAAGNKLYMDKLGNYTTSPDGNTAVYEIPNYTIVDAESKTIRASLQLYGFKIQGVGEVVIDEEPLAKQTITSLTQNQAKGITAMVYLDGNKVENADVAIGGTSMSGKLNLQFASDAALDPMDYTFGEKLPTPTASIDENGKLTITRAEGDTKTTKFKISVGKLAYEVALESGANAVTYTLPAEVPAGTYKIDIVAAAQGYVDSNKETVDYTKAATP